MRHFVSSLAASAALLVLAAPAAAQTSNTKASSGRKMQANATQQIPVCAKPIGVLAVVEPENQWWRELNLGSPEAIIKVFVQNSHCFTIVNRGRSMASRAMERAMADQGELQKGSNLGKGQVKAADYFLEPNIVSANRNSGGGGMGAAAGALGGLFGGHAGSIVGGIAGGINVKKGEANVTLSIVNARTTEEEALTEGYFRKRDVSFALGGGGGWWGGFAAAGGYGYEDTVIGQIIVLAYLDAYKKLVTQLGGLPANAAQAAPVAR
jgi:curli biogenesis system outer membrane secretion channel CsgG